LQQISVKWKMMADMAGKIGDQHFEHNNFLFIHTVDGSEIPNNHLGCKKTL